MKTALSRRRRCALAGATTGPLKVTNLGGTTTSTQSFTVDGLDSVHHYLQWSSRIVVRTTLANSVVNNCGAKEILSLGKRKWPSARLRSVSGQTLFADLYEKVTQTLAAFHRWSWILYKRGTFLGFLIRRFALCSIASRLWQAITNRIGSWRDETRSHRPDIVDISFDGRSYLRCSLRPPDRLFEK
jgi:hypothetical protein